MRTIIILIIAIVIAIIIAVVLSVYFLIGIDVNSKLEAFFDNDEQLKYYDNTTGKEIVIEQSVIQNLLKKELEGASFKNTVKINNKKDGGILLLKNEESIIFDGDNIKVGNNWYKANQDIAATLMKEINSIIK